MTAERVVPSDSDVERWWWAIWRDSAPRPYYIVPSADYVVVCGVVAGVPFPVSDSRWTWVEPAATPAEVAALRAEAESAERSMRFAAEVFGKATIKHEQRLRSAKGRAGYLEAALFGKDRKIAELQAQLDEIEPHLEAARLFSAADGAEVPTTIAERARGMAQILEAEMDERRRIYSAKEERSMGYKSYKVCPMVGSVCVEGSPDSLGQMIGLLIVADNPKSAAEDWLVHYYAVSPPEFIAVRALYEAETLVYRVGADRTIQLAEVTR
jgi:hypothetical protein